MIEGGENEIEENDGEEEYKGGIVGGVGLVRGNGGKVVCVI